MYSPNEREQQAELRHCRIKPSLDSAFQAFKTWLQGCDGLSIEEALLQLRSKSKELGSQILLKTPEESESALAEDPECDRLLGSKDLHSGHSVSADAIIAISGTKEGLQKCLGGFNGTPKEDAVEDEEQDLDLLALGDLQSLVKPKFSFCGDTERQNNLFNCLIKNTASEEREAIAYESEVIIPGSCSFLMADMSKFRLLLKGKHAVPQCRFPYFSVLWS